MLSRWARNGCRRGRGLRGTYCPPAASGQLAWEEDLRLPRPTRLAAGAASMRRLNSSMACAPTRWRSLMKNAGIASSAPVALAAAMSSWMVGVEQGVEGVPVEEALDRGAQAPAGPGQLSRRPLREADGRRAVPAPRAGVCPGSRERRHPVQLQGATGQVASVTPVRDSGPAPRIEPR